MMKPADEPELLAAVIVCMRQLGASVFWTVPTQWTERTYGPAE